MKGDYQVTSRLRKTMRSHYIGFGVTVHFIKDSQAYGIMPHGIFSRKFYIFEHGRVSEVQTALVV